MIFVAELALFTGGVAGLAAFALIRDKFENVGKTVIEVSDTDKPTEILIKVQKALAHQESEKERHMTATSM
jgi:hypothetical protein